MSLFFDNILADAYHFQAYLLCNMEYFHEFGMFVPEKKHCVILNMSFNLSVHPFVCYHNGRAKTSEN